MLYDILIIDDDFDTELDVGDWGNNAYTLLCDLIRKNLRVTWTTGEIEDLENLSEKDLSTIQFIFLDLHLESIKNDTSFTIINRKITSIFGKINSLITSKKVTCYINSKYFGKGYGDEGKGHLEKTLKENFKEKYSLEVVETKNALGKEQKNKLIKNNLAVYCKSLIINKAIEVEKIFDKKLQIDPKLRDVITFENKYKKLQKEFKLSLDNKKQIQLLQQIRNKLAHTEGKLNEISAPDMKKTFWKIISGQEDDKPIKFEDFDSLMKYIISIDDLCKSLSSNF